MNVVAEKKWVHHIPAVMDREYSFKEICDSLDEQHEEYISWKMKTYTFEEVWEKYINRSDTFLTSNK